MIISTGDAADASIAAVARPGRLPTSSVMVRAKARGKGLIEILAIVMLNRACAGKNVKC